MIPAILRWATQASSAFQMPPSPSSLLRISTLRDGSANTREITIRYIADDKDLCLDLDILNGLDDSLHNHVAIAVYDSKCDHLL